MPLRDCCSSGIKISSACRHGHTPFWFTNANQYRASFGSFTESSRLSPGDISSRTCVNITPASEITEVNVMLFTRAGSSFTAS